MRYAFGIAGTLVAATAGVLLQCGLASTPPAVAPPDLSGLLFDTTPVTVLFTIDSYHVPWATTAHDIRANTGLWRRMHLAEWNTVAIQSDGKASIGCSSGVAASS